MEGFPYIILQGCQSYYQFHGYHFSSQTYLHAFAHFLIHHLSHYNEDPKLSFHTQGLVAPDIFFFCKLLLLHLGGKNTNFVSGIQEFDWPWYTFLICEFHFRSLVIVTPRYLMLYNIFKNYILSRVYEAWIFFFCFCQLHRV